MQRRIASSRSNAFLIISLIIVVAIIISTNLHSKETAIIAADLIDVPVVGTFVVLSLITIKRFGTRGDHGKAWLFFAGFAVCWFVAEQTWWIYELVLEIDPYPSPSDLFWIAGYPLYLGFLIFYLKPVRKAINKKMIISSAVISAALLIPSVYITLYGITEMNEAEVILGLLYPILDSIVLVPALIGVSLFFGGRVNFMWTLACIGIILTVAADFAFLFTIIKETYYSGHPLEILYIWSYVVFSFGIYDHLNLFKTKQKQGSS